MNNEIAQRDVLGGFKRALDLVHGVDAAGLVGVQHIHSRRAGAAHLAVREERGMHGKGLERIGAEPLGQFDDMLAAGVVEVLARGKDLHRLRAGAGCESQAGPDADGDSETDGSKERAACMRALLRRTDMERKPDANVIFAFLQGLLFV